MLLEEVTHKRVYRVCVDRFKDPYEQGMRVHLHVVDMAVFTSMEQWTRMVGCTSPELVPTQTDWVEVLGRKFMVRAYGPFEAKHYPEADYSLILPAAVADAYTVAYNKEQDEHIPSLEQRVAELQQDIAFLAPRASDAGTSRSGKGDRDTGASSNCIVDLAYGVGRVATQILPGDVDDLNACDRMYAQLPKHRKTTLVAQAMDRARQYKASIPYAERCCRVARGILSTGEYAHCARIVNAIGSECAEATGLAWVHMLTDVRHASALHAAGVGEYIMSLSQQMVIRSDETYTDYIQRLGTNKLTKLVMRHKLQDWLKQDITTGPMRDKYELSLAILREVI